MAYQTNKGGQLCSKKSASQDERKNTRIFIALEVQHGEPRCAPFSLVVYICHKRVLVLSLAWSPYYRLKLSNIPQKPGSMDRL